MLFLNDGVIMCISNKLRSFRIIMINCAQQQRIDNEQIEITRWCSYAVAWYKFQRISWIFFWSMTIWSGIDTKSITLLQIWCCYVLMRHCLNDRIEFPQWAKVTCVYGDKISAKTKVSCLSTKQNVWTKAENTIDIDSFTSEETRVNHRFVLRLNMHRQIHCIHTIRRVSLTKHSITCNCLLNSIENIDTRVCFVQTLFQMYETLQRTDHKELYSIEFYWRHILLCKLKTYLAIIILAM